jgi:hypothetical protein
MSHTSNIVIDELNSNNKEKTIMNIKTVSFMTLVRDLIGEGHAIASRLTSVKANGWYRAVDAWYTATQGKDLKDTCIVDYKRMVEVALELTMLQAKVANLQATVTILESRLADNSSAATIIKDEYGGVLNDLEHKVDKLQQKVYKPIEKFSVMVRFFVNPEEGVVADDTETHAYIGIGEEDEDHPQDNTIFFYTKLTAEAFMKQHTKENSTEDFYVVKIAD